MEKALFVLADVLSNLVLEILKRDKI